MFSNNKNFLLINFGRDSATNGLRPKENAMLRNWLIAAFAAIVLAACGGEEVDEAPASSMTAQAVVPQWDLSQAMSAGQLLHGAALPPQRMRALAADTCTVTVDEFMNWAEGLKLPAFFNGPKTMRAPHLGVTYDFRFYPGAGMGNYIGVVVAGGPVNAVFVMGSFTEGKLLQFGVLADYVRDIKGDCKSTAAGTLSLSEGDQRLNPVFNANGELTYVGAADNGIYKPKVSDIDQVCWNSQRLGWGKFNTTTKPRGCTKPAADGTLKFAGMCSNDAGLPTLWTKDGKELWPDFRDAKGWKLAGDLNPQLAAIQGGGFLITYGKNGYQASTLSYQNGTLTMNFASDCFGGGSFSKPLEVGDLEFRWNSDVDGWLAQSKKRSILSWDAATQKFREVVTFTGLTCGQRGTISVHKPKSKNGNTIVWDDEPYAWFSIPEQGNPNPFWKNGAGIDWFHQVLINRQEHSAVLKC